MNNLKNILITGLVLMGLLVTTNLKAAAPCITNVAFTVTMATNCTAAVIVTDPVLGIISPFAFTRTYPLDEAAVWPGDNPCDILYAHHYYEIHVALETSCCSTSATPVGILSFMKNDVFYTNTISLPPNTYIGMWTVYESGTNCESATIESCLFKQVHCPDPEPPRD